MVNIFLKKNKGRFGFYLEVLIKLGKKKAKRLKGKDLI